MRSLLPFAAIILASLLIQAPEARAGEFNRVLDIGDAAPQWDALPMAAGGEHPFAELSEAKVVVVAFTCNRCPYAVDAEARLVALDAWLKERGGALVAINVNKTDGEGLDEMRRRAEERGFAFPYLYDESQQIARRYGATTTPEFFVLDGDRKVVYMGALDDSPDGKQIGKTFVRDAVTAVLDGQTVAEAETVPIGCRIRYERARRGRSGPAR